MSEQQPVFNIEKIYVKDMSLEIPHAPGIFLQREQPQIDMQLHNEANKIDDGYYESSITVTVTAKLGEQTMFLAEATQAGIFQIRNVPEGDMDPVLGIGCPNILFPYARECITSLVSRGTFPQLNLAPVNFDALFMNYLQQQAGEGAEQHQDA